MPKILIIEDDQSLSNLYTTIFKTYGYQVVQTITGQEGRMLALQENPDLILLDYRLPDATGLEILEKLFQEKIVPKTPVLIITNFAGDISQYQQQLHSLGVREILLKYKITLTKLVDKVRKYTSTNTHIEQRRGVKKHYE